MNKLLLSAILLCFLFSAQAQEVHHRVRIDLQHKSMPDLAKLGIEVDHGNLALGRYIENDFSEKEIKMIQEAGFKTTILIQNMSEYYRNQSQISFNKMFEEGCFEDPVFSSYITPSNFTLGSMGGFYTLDELYAILDDMQEKYPNLISVKKQIGDIVTHEGRPIYSVVISDNPEMEESDEPQTLYTALHHAREPNSLSQLIFFMWHMLENYETDNAIKEIINETQLHFIPCVNPDGYVYNQTIEPNGGGLWRKNRRNNGDGTFGVDLNRNYGFQWGFDNNGSSPNTDSEVYRGISAFSEPETQAVKLYCETHSFNFALNNHTFGNLLIYPWGYNDTPTAENEYFRAISEELTKLNKYTFGTGSETVGYVVNGDADDYMYGEETTKNKIYSMTPEAGTEGFWPPMENIINNCQANTQANISLAAFNLNYPVVEVLSIDKIDAYSGTINYEVSQLGFKAAPFEVIAEAISDNVTFSNSTIFDLQQLEQINNAVNYEIKSNVEFGDEIIMVVRTVSITPFNTDTIRIKFLEGADVEEVVKEEYGEGLFWEADNELWFYTTEDFISPGVSFTDSPNKDYSAGTNKNITSEFIKLPDAENVQLSFEIKVDIEEGYDYAQLSILQNGAQPIPLCGIYTTNGTNDQEENEPVYDGSFGWVTENIDLTLWANKTVRFLWEMKADNFVEGDGIYVDDWTIAAINPPPVSVGETKYKDFKIFPNPASDVLHIEIPYQEISQIRIYNVLGNKVKEISDFTEFISTENLNDGLYEVVVYFKNGEITSKKLVIQK